VLLKEQRERERAPALSLTAFQASEVAELPPRLRALFEDNRVSSSSSSRPGAAAAAAGGQGLQQLLPGS
jgi:hypothetical protein